MIVELLTARATAKGPENVGDVIEVSDQEGARLIDAGQAKAVKRTKTRRTAVAADVSEKAVK